MSVKRVLVIAGSDSSGGAYVHQFSPAIQNFNASPGRLLSLAETNAANSNLVALKPIKEFLLPMGAMLSQQQRVLRRRTRWV